MWEEHHLEFAKFIYKYKPQNVLEIGACHGILFQKYLRFNKRVKWTIIEPNPQIDKSIKVKIIKKFFDEKTIIPSSIDVFTHSHVIEHIYDLHKFMNDLDRKISSNKLMIFSIPHLEIMLKKVYELCKFQHTIFLTEPYLKYFLDLYGFEVLEKKFLKKIIVFFMHVKN